MDSSGNLRPLEVTEDLLRNHAKDLLAGGHTLSRVAGYLQFDQIEAGLWLRDRPEVLAELEEAHGKPILFFSHYTPMGRVPQWFETAMDFLRTDGSRVRAMQSVGVPYNVLRRVLRDSPVFRELLVRAKADYRTRLAGRDDPTRL